MPQTGPRTTAGKAVASRNALKHGILSRAPVIPGLEDPAEWQRHLKGMFESLQPEGHLEAVLAERIAVVLWRLRRVTQHETEMTQVYLERIPGDYAAVEPLLKAFSHGTAPQH